MRATEEVSLVVPAALLSRDSSSSTVKRTPPASSDAVRIRMQNTPRRNTKPEVALRSELHRLGLRYRIDRSPIPGERIRCDLVFRASRVVVNVDGCFWHACPTHGVVPKINSEWWAEKLAKTRKRDIETNEKLRSAGWKVMRVWEHESPNTAAAKIAKVIDRRLKS